MNYYMQKNEYNPQTNHTKEVKRGYFFEAFGLFIGSVTLIVIILAITPRWFQRIREVIIPNSPPSASLSNSSRN
jgi:hypothetical protein